MAVIHLKHTPNMLHLSVVPSSLIDNSTTFNIMYIFCVHGQLTVLDAFLCFSL